MSKTPIVEHRPFSKPSVLIMLLRAIETYITANGFPPSISELADMGYGSSTSVIRYYYSRMVEEGMLQVTPRVSRGLRPLPIENWSERMRNAVIEEVEA